MNLRLIKMMNRLRKLIQDEAGNSMVSLVFSSVPMVFIFAMLISYGQWLYGLQVAQNAAACGARAAAIYSDIGSAKAAADSVARQYVDRAQMGVTYADSTIEASGWERKKPFEYYVTVQVHTALPIHIGSGGIEKEKQIRRSCPAVVEGN